MVARSIGRVRFVLAVSRGVNVLSVWMATAHQEPRERATAVAHLAWVVHASMSTVLQHVARVANESISAVLQHVARVANGPRPLSSPQVLLSSLPQVLNRILLTPPSGNPYRVPLTSQPHGVLSVVSLILIPRSCHSLSPRVLSRIPLGWVSRSHGTLARQTLSGTLLIGIPWSCGASGFSLVGVPRSGSTLSRHIPPVSRSHP